MCRDASCVVELFGYIFISKWHLKFEVRLRNKKVDREAWIVGVMYRYKYPQLLFLFCSAMHSANKGYSGSKGIYVCVCCKLLVPGDNAQSFAVYLTEALEI